MAGKQAQPLTTEEAKQQLHGAVREAGFSAWVQREPLRAVALGLLAGILLGGSPRVQELVLRFLK
jgi:hypothetical protein